MDPLITVIIPSYNRAEKILASAKSVLNQTYSNLELIIVDDGSTDNTEEVLSQINDSRLRYIWQENSGACAATNNGIRHANGEYIAFNDSDDTWKENKLERQLETIQKTGADIVFCKLSIPQADGSVVLQPAKIREGFVDYSSTDLVGIGTQTLFFKKKVLMDFKFEERIPRLQDLELLINIMNSKKYNLYCMNEGLLDNYVMSDDSISVNPKKLLVALDIIEKKYPDIKEDSPVLANGLADLVKIVVIDELKKGNYATALQYEKKSLGYITKVKILYPIVFLVDWLKIIKRMK